MIPDRIIAAPRGAAVAEVRSQDFVTTLRAMGWGEGAVIAMCSRMLRRRCLAVMGCNSLPDGRSILVETVFTWARQRLLLFRRSSTATSRCCRATILALSLIFVATNLVVDLLQAVHGPEDPPSMNERVVVAPGAIPADSEADGAPPIVVRAIGSRCCAGCAMIG